MWGDGDKLNRIIHLLEEIEFEVRHSRKILENIEDLIESNLNRVLGGVMSEIGDTMPLLPIAPGFSPQFAVTPTPAGVATLAANTVWSSSDTTNFPVTANASDATGLTATVNIPTTAPVTPTEFSLTWVYTNADGTTATVTQSFTSVAPPPTDVTGGTMAQSV